MREAIIFDTEFTSWEGSLQRRWTAPGEFREIIQIGAICIDRERLVETGSFEILVKPVFNPVLSDFIVSLTGIQQSDVDARGATLAQAVDDFLAFADGRKMFCYGYDGLIIAKNLALLGQADHWPGLRPSNIGYWFAGLGMDLSRLNSGSLAKALGSPFSAPAHDAVNDCRSIAEAIRILVSRGAPDPFLTS